MVRRSDAGRPFGGENVGTGNVSARFTADCLRPGAGLCVTRAPNPLRGPSGPKDACRRFAGIIQDASAVLQCRERATNTWADGSACTPTVDHLMHARSEMTNGFSVGNRLELRALVALLVLGLCLLGPVSGRAEAQGPARADAAASLLRQGWFSRSLDFEVALDRAVPFRAFTLDAPPRLVLDFANLDWDGFDPRDIRRDGGEAPVRVGRIGPGWSRLVLDLDAPLALDTAEMQPDGSGVRLSVALRRVGTEAFAAASGAPPGVWPSGGLPFPSVKGAGDVMVAIDPGHGGIDPGSIQGGVQEKTVVLDFGLALRDALIVQGFRVLMTREDDDFVALADRVSAARQAGADVFLSIHLNSEETPDVAGAIAFTRADRGSSARASARAREENASDMLAGLETVQPGDPVRDILVGMARTETDIRSAVLADALVGALEPVASIWIEPRQSADFEVLRAPDMPSVLLELGFLSNASDREALLSPAWRSEAADALANGIAGWLAVDADLASKLRR